MASGTILLNNSPAGSNGTYIQGKIVWEEVEQTTSGVPPLTSKVKATLWVRKANDSTTLTTTTGGSWTYSYQIADATASNQTFTADVLGWTQIPNWTLTKTITHNATTGKATCYLWASITSPSTSTAVPSKTTSGDKTVTLDTLYVAPTYSASSISANSSSVRMGESVSFTINRSSTALTHVVTYNVNGYTGYISTSATTSCSWTVPDLLSYTNGKNTTATITCETYNGGELIGSKSTSVTVMPYAASTISLSKEEVDVGGSLTIGVTSKCPSYSHEIKYKLNSGNEVALTTISGGGSYAWSVPNSLANSMVGNDTLTIYCYTKYNSTAIGSKSSATCSVIISQATIPTISPSTVVMGNNLTISLPRAVPTFDHVLTYNFAGGGTNAIDAHIGDSYSWTVPYKLAKQIRGSTSGTGYIEVYTWNGDTQVGSEQRVQFTAVVPDNEITKPTFTLTISKVQPQGLPAALEEYWIQGVSKVQADFSDVASEYSTIPVSANTYKLTVGGSVTHDNPSVSNEIQSSGTATVIGSVTDARGYTRDISETIDVLPYSQPRVIPYTGYSDIVCERCTDTGTPASDGTYLLVKAARTYSPIEVDGTALNSCVFQYRSKEASASWQGDEVGWQTLSTTETVNTVLSGIVSDISKEYTIQIRAKDAIPNKHIITVTIPSEVTPLHLAEGGTGIGIGRLCDGDGMHIGWGTTFHTGINRNVIFITSSLTKGWDEGNYLTADFPSADDSKVSEYSLFLAVATGIANSTTKRYAVLCARQEDKICGSLDIATDTGIQTISLGMTYDENNGLMLDSAKSMIHTASGSHGALTTLSVSNQLFITALYALL